MKQAALLINQRQGWAVWLSLWSSFIQPAMRAGHRIVVELRTEDAE